MAKRNTSSVPLYVGLDVHKDSISVAYAIDDGSEIIFLGRFAKSRKRTGAVHNATSV